MRVPLDNDLELEIYAIHSRTYSNFCASRQVRFVKLKQCFFYRGQILNTSSKITLLRLGSNIILMPSFKTKRYVTLAGVNKFFRQSPR